MKTNRHKHFGKTVIYRNKFNFDRLINGSVGTVMYVKGASYLVSWEGFEEGYNGNEFLEYGAPFGPYSCMWVFQNEIEYPKESYDMLFRSFLRLLNPKPTPPRDRNGMVLKVGDRIRSFSSPTCSRIVTAIDDKYICLDGLRMTRTSMAHPATHWVRVITT